MSVKKNILSLLFIFLSLFFVENPESDRSSLPGLFTVGKADS